MNEQLNNKTKSPPNHKRFLFAISMIIIMILIIIIFFLKNYQVITVKKDGTGDYSIIQEAINFAKQIPDKKIIIKIHPGEYKEHLILNGERISLLGTNRDTCIIRDDSGDYVKAPLTASGNANISNLTFLSTHNDKIAYAIPSYAVHLDSPGAGTMTFKNCKMVSMQNSAVGIGTQQDQTLIFDHCEIRKNSSYAGGAFYCHNSSFSNVTNQHIIVKNCHITTNIGSALKIDDANTFNNGNNSPMDIAFYNNTLSSDQLDEDTDVVCFRDAPLNDGISGQIKLVKDSHGNNIKELNAKP